MLGHRSPCLPPTVPLCLNPRLALRRDLWVRTSGYHRRPRRQRSSCRAAQLDGGRTRTLGHQRSSCEERSLADRSRSHPRRRQHPCSSTRGWVRGLTMRACLAEQAILEMQTLSSERSNSCTSRSFLERRAWSEDCKCLVCFWPFWILWSFRK